MCRCEAKKTFIWGDKCGSLTDGLCGMFCKDCREANFWEDAAGTAPTCRCIAW
jgi:hypothetical protein